MRFSTLQEWLAWQETLHPKAVDLKLDRVRKVLGRMEMGQAPATIIIVAGTNGKGSAVALLESIFLAQEYRVGAYTSPHLLRYNERIHIKGQEVSDVELCEAFAAVDSARQEIRLTYFEFGTLAALWLFARSELDLMVLEVGLGGRLDAVNAVDPDVALITTIDMDHMGWLGADREAIGREKAGIFRAKRPAVCADPDPPKTLFQQARRLNVPLLRLNKEFSFEITEEQWNWYHGERSLTNLPLPALSGVHQVQNAAGVLSVLDCLADRLPVGRQAIEQGLRSMKLPARFQVLGDPTLIVDVAHNPQAARALANTLQALPRPGATIAVLGMLDDKDVEGVAQAVEKYIDSWHLAPVRATRSLPVMTLHERLETVVPGAHVCCYPTVAEALIAARKRAGKEGRIVAFGSFYTVAEVMQLDLESTLERA